MNEGIKKKRIKFFLHDAYPSRTNLEQTDYKETLSPSISIYAQLLILIGSKELEVEILN